MTILKDSETISVLGYRIKVDVVEDMDGIADFSFSNRRIRIAARLDKATRKRVLIHEIGEAIWRLSTSTKLMDEDKSDDFATIWELGLMHLAEHEPETLKYLLSRRR